jgi:predicted MFS family arabinose efflux permease
MKILARYLPQRKLSTANKMMTSGPAVAGVISYGTAAIFGDNWQAPFILLGVLLLFCIVAFFLSVNFVQSFPIEDEFLKIDETKKASKGADFIPLESKKSRFFFYLCSILFGAGVTALFFAMNNTLDIFLQQIGGFDNTTAKWATVLAPVTFIIGPVLCVYACDKHENFILVGAVFFGLSFVVALLLLLFFETSVFLSMALLLLYLILTNGGRSISLSIVGLKLRDKIDTGVYSTLVNAAASISAGVIPKLFTSIVDNSSSITQNWLNAFTVLTVSNAIVVIILIALAILIKKLKKN